MRKSNNLTQMLNWFIPLRPSRIRPSRIRPRRLRPSRHRPITQIILVKTRYYVSIFIQYPVSILKQLFTFSNLHLHV